MGIVQLDINSVSYFVTQGLKMQDRRITALNTEQAKLQSEKAQYTAVRSELTKLRTQVQDLAMESKLMPGKGMSSDATVAGVTVGAGAVPSTYNLIVGSLADAHTVASSAWTAAGTELTVAEGIGQRDFQVTVGGVSVAASVTLAAGDTNELAQEKIRDAINAASADVVASLIHESEDGTTLIVQSRKTGVAQRMSASDTSGTLLKSLGLIDAGSAPARVMAAGDDASVTVNGMLTLTSSSNELSDALPGLTLNLNKIGSTTLTVTSDTKAAADKVVAFVDAYNLTIKKIRSAMDEKPVEGEPKTGTLYRDSLLQSVSRALRREMLWDPGLTEPPSTILGLGALGVKPVSSINDGGRSGELQVDRTDLEEALASKPRDVLAAFANATDGLSTRLEAAIDRFTDVESGSLALKLEAGTSRMERVSAFLRAANTQRTKRSGALTKRYNDMLATQQKYSSQLAFIQQMSGAA